MARKTKLPKARRSKGRPASDQSGVGREAIIAEASDFLKRHSSDGPTRAEFSRQAGIDPSLIRYYFSNMSSLLTEGMRGIFIDLQSRREAVAPDAPFRIQLRRRIESLIEVLEANPQLHQLMMAPVIHVEPDKVEEVVALRRDYTLSSFGSLESLLAAAQAVGESVVTDSPLFYIVLIAVCDFVVRCHQYFDILPVQPGTRSEMLSRYADFVTDLLIDGLRPRT